MKALQSVSRMARISLAVLALALLAGMLFLSPMRGYATELAAQASGVAAGTTSVSIEVQYGQTEARSMLAMINSFRTGSDAWEWDENNAQKVWHSGLGELAYDYELERVAKLRAAEIALSYSHTRPDGSSKAWDAFDGWWAVGENIAAGYPNAKSVFSGWQETNEPYAGQGHRRNMLSEDFTAVGIGHVVCNGYHFWVQEFCAPTLNATPTAANDSKSAVAIDVASSALTKRTATATPNSITVRVGETRSLPSASGAVGTADTWPAGTVPVAGATATWSSSNASIAKISNGTVKGLRAGSANLVAKVSVAGSTVNVSVPVEVVKAANPMKVSGLTAKVSYSKKKSRTVKPSLAYKFSAKAAGAVTYTRVSRGSSKWLPKVSPKTGAITVKKGAPKGKVQKVKVKVTAKGDASHKPGSKTVTVKVRVK